MDEERPLAEWMYEELDNAWYQAEYALFWEDDGYEWIGLTILMVQQTYIDPDMEGE